LTTLTQNALDVLKHRPYLLPDETPSSLFQRVAYHIASAEEHPHQYEDKFYRLLSSLDFLPNTPTLLHAGAPGHENHSLSACFVLPIDDTLESIMETLKHAALIEKSGGGTGFGLSRIRPRGDKISTVPNSALGPMPVLEMYSTSLHWLTQATVRRGAHMAQLYISHPDILEFIEIKSTIKDKDNPLSNFNISVQIPDSFFYALEADAMWPLINPRTNEMVSEISARSLWNTLCYCAWLSGDPGCVFIDRVHESAPNPTFGPIESSNPCGEEFLEPYGSCNLGSINLAHAVIDGAIDWDWLRDTVVLAVRFLDNVITVNRFPDSVPQIRNVNLLTRRIGLGVMGWADLLDQLGISYDSDEALSLARHLSKFITTHACRTSEELAKEKGEFPLWPESNLGYGDDHGHPIPVRNSSVTTIAPTGTISIIAGCSSGIEPHYSLIWTRKALWDRNNNGTEQGALSLLECPNYIRSEIQRLGLNEEEVLGKMLAVPDPLLVLPSYGIDCAHLRTAMEIDPAAHVKMLAAWQSSVTNSVSKTINLPSDATVDDISSAFQLAWNLNCKSVTVYRDGSKEIQVLNHLNCEECGGETRYEGGCRVCVSCGLGSCDVVYGG